MESNSFVFFAKKSPPVISDWVKKYDTPVVGVKVLLSSCPPGPISIKKLKAIMNPIKKKRM